MRGRGKRPLRDSTGFLLDRSLQVSRLQGAGENRQRYGQRECWDGPRWRAAIVVLPVGDRLIGRASESPPIGQVGCHPLQRDGRQQERACIHRVLDTLQPQTHFPETPFFARNRPFRQWDSPSGCGRRRVRFSFVVVAPGAAPGLGPARIGCSTQNLPSVLRLLGLALLPDHIRNPRFPVHTPLFSLVERECCSGRALRRAPGPGRRVRVHTRSAR